MTMSRQDDPFDLLLPLDGQPGPARRLPRERARDMVGAALAAMDAAAEAPASVSQAGAGLAPVPEQPAQLPSSSPVPGTAAPRRRGSVMFLAAAVVLVAGVASAGIYAWVERYESERSAVQPAIDDETENQPGGEPENRPSREPVVQPDAPDTPDAPNTQDASDPPQAAEPSAPAPDRRRRASKPRSAVAQDRQAGKSDTPTAPAKPADEPREPPRTPEDLMKLANQQRSSRNWRAADELYQRIVRDHGGTHAAYVATIASAAIHLDHLADPRGALRLYRAALAADPRNALAEEARWGVAEAYRKLGDGASEASALATFVARHPDSPLRQQAEERLRALRAAGDAP